MKKPYLVIILLLFIESVMTQAPGDGSPICLPGGLLAFLRFPIPENMKVLMESRDYETLLGNQGEPDTWQQVDVDGITGPNTIWVQQGDIACRQMVTVCGFNVGQQDNWLITQHISRQTDTLLPQVTVIVEYEFSSCDAASDCSRTFSVQRYDTSTMNATAARDTTKYIQVANIAPEDITGNERQNETINMDFTSSETGFYLAVRDQDSCLFITRILVFYFVCPAVTENLIIFPETLAPPISTTSQPISVNGGQCVENSRPSVGDNPTMTCSQGGVWSIISGCTCNSGFSMNADGTACIANITIGFTQEEYPVTENEGSVRVFLERNNVMLDRDISFTIFTIMGPGEAVAGEDYEAVAPMDLVFDMSMGNDSVIGVDIIIINDTVCEKRECFYAVINSSDSCLVDPAMARVCIDDDDSVLIEPEDPTFTIPEGPPVQYVDIPIVIRGMKELGLECNVTVHTVDGSAWDGEDYYANWENFTFSADDPRQIFQVLIIDDLIPEQNEYFTVSVNVLNGNCPCQAGKNATVTIIDDEDCDDMPCIPNADCQELPGPNTFTCECIPPSVGDGFTCRSPILDVGDDPHFSIALPSGKLLCYTVQGEHGFTFNLISNKKIHMNAMFVPDSRREEVTWLGSMGIVIHSSRYKRSNGTALRFEAKVNTIHVGDKIMLKARNIEKLTFSNGKLTISEAPPSEGFKYPAVYVDLQDVSLSFTIKFMNDHLDLFWYSTGQVIGDSHGIIGQFFRKGVEIDEVRKILIMPNKESVPVMRRPVWSFMEREVADDQLCWTAMNPGYQGEGLIDGEYFDYIVNDVLTADFKFKKQQ